MIKRITIFMLLFAMPLAGLRTSLAQSIAPKTQSATVTIYRDLVRFVVAEAHQIRIEIFNQKQEKIFDSNFVSGAALDWFTHDQQGQAVDSGLYSYVISIRKENGETVEAQRGNIILDRERQNLTDAPSQKNRHGKGDITLQSAGVFDVEARDGSYNIKTPLMGIGTAEPLARLHLGAESKEPATAGAALLIEEGSQSAMVMRSSSGGEMFLIQNDVGGVIGTVNGSPLSIRTDNLDRVTIATNGNVGIGTTAPSTRLHVSGNELVSGNLTVSGTLNANLPAGSTNYIQNTGSQQVNTSFNISGNGTLGGTLAAGVVNAATQYNIGGQRVLSIGGSGNVFAGVGAGSANTGVNNAFFGVNAGLSNTTGGYNGFFGTSAGAANTTGCCNAFFGDSAGPMNTTGASNSFFGSAAGYSNTTGEANTFVGRGAGFTNTTGRENAFFGLFAGLFNTASNNAFFGSSAGRFNTTGYSNAFFGSDAGYNNTTGLGNSFFGFMAGLSTTTGHNNSFFGSMAGANSTGFYNSFFGSWAGQLNSTGAENLFAGSSAARANTTGSRNLIMGSVAGASNTSENENTLLGYSANGAAAITNATAIGAKASVTQSNSLVLGSINGINSATASVKVGIGTTTPGATLEMRRDGNIGSSWQNAQLRISGSTDPAMQLNLGYDTTNNLAIIQPGHANYAFKNLSLNPFGGNVGIGTTNPTHKLEVNGSVAGLGPYQDLSDRRYKTNITALANPLEKVMKMRGVSFDWRQEEFPNLNFNPGRQVGFIAQEIEAVLPEAVSKDARGVYRVAYSSIVPLLVEAFKLQQKTVEQISAENAEKDKRFEQLSRENVALQERLAALERSLEKLIKK